MSQGAVRTDGTSAYAEGESFLTGSKSKAERVEALIEWILTPDDERNPKTKREFAELWGVSSQTIRNDLREPRLQREVAQRARALARVDRLPEVLENLYRLATAGLGPRPGVGESSAATPANAQVSAAKTLLDWMERTAPIREGEDLNLEGMTDEQLMEAGMRFLEMVNRDDPTS